MKKRKRNTTSVLCTTARDTCNIVKDMFVVISFLGTIDFPSVRMLYSYQLLSNNETSLVDRNVPFVGFLPNDPNKKKKKHVKPFFQNGKTTIYMDTTQSGSLFVSSIVFQKSKTFVVA